jgi:hypothetical protein
MLQREASVGAEHGERLTELTEKLTKAKERLKVTNDRWTEEKRLVKEIQDRRKRLETHAAAKAKGEMKG